MNDKLTKREIEVLALIAEGKSSAEVAALLFIAKRTVDFHLFNIFNKFEVKNRIQALRVAHREGYFRK